MPNFLKVTVWMQFPSAPATEVWQVTPVGIGNSPPEIKVADSPEMAVRLGSASVRTTPAVSMARRVAVTERRPLVSPVAAKALPGTRGVLFAVNGLLLLKFTIAVP